MQSAAMHQACPCIVYNDDTQHANIVCEEMLHATAGKITLPVQWGGALAHANTHMFAPLACSSKHW